MENFVHRNVYTPTTPEDRRTYGTPLPMKRAYMMQNGVRCKDRGLLCGNFEQTDLTQQLWTAQAETSSLVAALRLTFPPGWVAGAVDVSGAFMHAPLPEHMLVVVRPPHAFVDAGLVAPDELWKLTRAVHGLKVSPRAWGLHRDSTL